MWSCLNHVRVARVRSHFGSIKKHRRVSTPYTSSVEVREIEAMAKTMKQMKSIIKSYLQKRVSLQRDIKTIVAANLAAIVAAHQVVQQAPDNIVAAHQAALQAQHDQVLQQAVEARENGGADDEWLIAHEYENEEWEDGV